MKMTWAFSGNEATMEDILLGVGAGWRALVTQLLVDLEKLGWDGTVYQVKEKFGGLRFYIGAGSEEIHDRIQQAEDESYCTCEVTGAPGVLRTDLSWSRVLCDEEYKKIKDKQTKKEWGLG